MKYVAYLPVYASAKFTLEVDEPIPESELLSRFISEAETDGSVCHQCANQLECDFQIDEANSQDADISGPA